VREASCPHHDAADIGREQSATSDKRRHPEREQCDGEREHGVKTARARSQTPQHVSSRPADRDAAARADSERGCHRERYVSGDCTVFHQALRERGSHQKRHRIVEPRFEFQDRADAFLQLNA
jgi:hypothetical protein